MVIICRRHTTRLSAVLCFTAIATVVVSSCNMINGDLENTHNEVRLHLALSASQQAAETRSTFSEVLGNGFQGIECTYLIPFNKQGTIESGDARNSNPQVLGSFDQLIENNNSKLFDWIAVPRGTASYLVYAKSGGQTTGDLDVDVSTETPAGYTFTPKGFTPDKTKGQRLADYLTSIANATGWSSVSENVPLRAARNKFLEMKAGASLNVKGEVQLLYDMVKGGGTVYDAIKSAILSSTYGVTVSGGSSTLTFPDNLLNYPAESGLPDGAAAIEWKDNKFVLSDNQLYSALNVAKMDVYVKPVPLFYRTNSLLATDNEDLKDLYTSSYTWDWDHNDASTKNSSILGHHDNYPGTVTSSTNSAAIITPLQFAVARLDVKIISETTVLKDYEGSNVSLGSTAFPITGLLVGGQYKVGYDFTPKDDQEYIVYDSNLKTRSGAAVYLQQANDFTSSNVTPFYSLVLEGKAAAGEDDFVNVAVEFQNNSDTDFIGVGGNLIPRGCKFYMVAQLKAWEKNQKKAFVQDYITNINLKVRSLQGAYNVIPDIRKQDLKVGLSVEDWIFATPTDIGL